MSLSTRFDHVGDGYSFRRVGHRKLVCSVPDDSLQVVEGRLLRKMDLLHGGGLLTWQAYSQSLRQSFNGAAHVAIDPR